MPFEVWKTYMGANQGVGTMQAFRSVYQSGGVGAFWKGWQPKMVESFLKGGILLFAKEGIIRTSKGMGCGEISAGILGGFGGGVAQVSIMGPCTFLVTASVAQAGAAVQMGTMQRISHVMKTQGVAGFYKGGTALMLRQGSNWASRQGLTDVCRAQIRRHKGGDDKMKLSVLEEALAGTFGVIIEGYISIS
jgi:hypothetical protein